VDYCAFLKSKRIVFEPSGVRVEAEDIHPKLFDFQRALVGWAVKKGRSAIFADCGLGKTFMQIEWARIMGGKSLIVAPLSVARQTVNEAKKIDQNIYYTRSGNDLIDGINITNYEMIDHFNPDDFVSVVLDESSILKGLTGKTRAKLVDMFADTQYRLCCTATPAPNDIAEIANHAEFLGIMNRADMLATFFVHDDQGWRLKKHATEPFYRWMASWGMSLRKPSDIGFNDDGFILPSLSINPVIVEVGYKPDDQLFWTGLKGVSDRAQVRRSTLHERVAAAKELIASNSDQWIAWVGLNDEGRELYKILDDAVLIEGHQSPEEKAAAIEGFQDGQYRVMVTKPKIAGFGMNLQNAADMVFVGLSDSYEAYYQCIRRSWRFGQNNPVSAYVVLSDAEEAIFENVKRKEREADFMADNLIKNVSEYESEEISESHLSFEYKKDEVVGSDYKIMLGDSVERINEVENNSVDLSVFSPPFLSLYTYTPTERDIGNSKTESEFYDHFNYIIDGLLRITKPGRNCCCHVAQVPAMLARDGYIGLKDFRGKTVNAFEDRGWIFHGEVTIDKCPQAQAIRTHSKGLSFGQLKKDSSWLRPAMADYILVFRKPGDNKEPIIPDVTNNEWIEWARPVWYGIRESNTLNVGEGRGCDDERHICPLQLGTIERCVKLWSNPGDVVFSPFMGIGSEGYQSLKLGRKFIGIELKESYFNAAVKNMAAAVEDEAQLSLFVGGS
jgi:DNA modification methylase/superfamily II DNA or RNA helicase